MCLVEIRVGFRHKTFGIEIGLVIYRLRLHSATGTGLVDEEVVVVRALDSYAEALGKHIEALGYVNVKIELGVVGLLISIAVEHEHTVAEHFSERHEVLRDNGPDSVNEARTGERMGPDLGDNPRILVLAGSGNHIERLPPVAHIASDTEFHLGRAGELHIHIRTVIEPVVAVVVVVFLVRELLQKTILEEVAEGDEILHLVISAGDVDIVLGLEEHIIEDVIRPVHARIHYRVRAGPVGLDLFPGEIHLGVGHAIELLLDVPEACIFVRAGLLHERNRLLDTA